LDFGELILNKKYHKSTIGADFTKIYIRIHTASEAKYASQVQQYNSTVTAFSVLMYTTTKIYSTSMLMFTE
jgi:hypothetical protein